MTGILIGLLIAGLYILFSNTARPTSNDIAIARATARIIGTILILASIGGLVDAYI